MDHQYTHESTKKPMNWVHKLVVPLTEDNDLTCEICHDVMVCCSALPCGQMILTESHNHTAILWSIKGDLIKKFLNNKKLNLLNLVLMGIR